MHRDTNTKANDVNIANEALKVSEVYLNGRFLIE